MHIQLSETESALLAKYVNTYKEFDFFFSLLTMYIDISMKINIT